MMQSCHCGFISLSDRISHRIVDMILIHFKIGVPSLKHKAKPWHTFCISPCSNTNMKSTPVSRGGSGGGNGNVDDESLQLIRGGDVPLAPSLSSPPLGRKRIAGSSQQQSSKRSLRGKEILDPYLGIAERESAEIMSMSMPPKPWCFDLPDKERCTRLDGCIYNYREYNMCCCGGARPDRTWAPLPTDEGSIGSGPFDSGPAPIGSSSSSSSSSGGGSFFFLIFFSIFIVVVGVCAFMPKSSSGRSGGRRRGGSGHVVSGPPHAHVDSGGGNWGWVGVAVGTAVVEAEVEEVVEVSNVTMQHFSLIHQYYA